MDRVDRLELQALREQQAVSAFLKRLEDLQPRLAVFLVDTELRMRDKIDPLFTEALHALGEAAAAQSVHRLPVGSASAGEARQDSPEAGTEPSGKSL